MSQSASSGFVLVLLFSTQIVGSSSSSQVNPENPDILLDWIAWAKQAYYAYELEANTLLCILRGVWGVAEDWVVREPDTIVPQILAIVSAGLGRGSIESPNATAGKTPAASTSLMRMNKRQVRESRLASLLGILDSYRAEDYHPAGHQRNARDMSEAAGKSAGAFEIAMMKIMLESHPLIAALVKLLGAAVYLVQRGAEIVKSSVILSCVSDYAYTRGSEWMYLDV